MAKNNLEHPCRIPGTYNWSVRVQQSQSVKCPRVLRSPKLILAISKVSLPPPSDSRFFLPYKFVLNDVCKCEIRYLWLPEDYILRLRISLVQFISNFKATAKWAILAFSYYDEFVKNIFSNDVLPIRQVRKNVSQKDQRIAQVFLTSHQ